MVHQRPAPGGGERFCVRTDRAAVHDDGCAGPTIDGALGSDRWATSPRSGRSEAVAERGFGNDEDRECTGCAFRKCDVAPA